MNANRPVLARTTSLLASLMLAACASTPLPEQQEAIHMAQARTCPEGETYFRLQGAAYQGKCRRPDGPLQKTRVPERLRLPIASPLRSSVPRNEAGGKAGSTDARPG